MLIIRDSAASPCMILPARPRRPSQSASTGSLRTSRLRSLTAAKVKSRAGEHLRLYFVKRRSTGRLFLSTFKKGKGNPTFFFFFPKPAPLILLSSKLTHPQAVFPTDICLGVPFLRHSPSLARYLFVTHKNCVRQIVMEYSTVCMFGKSF